MAYRLIRMWKKKILIGIEPFHELITDFLQNDQNKTALIKKLHKNTGLYIRTIIDFVAI